MVEKLSERAKNIRGFILGLTQKGYLRLNEGEIMQVYPNINGNFSVGYYNPRKSEGENLFLSNEMGGVMPHSPVASEEGKYIPYGDIESIWRRGCPHHAYDLIYHFDDKGNGRNGGVKGRKPIPQSAGKEIVELVKVK